jgi:hypothetical protein
MMVATKVVMTVEMTVEKLVLMAYMLVDLAKRIVIMEFNHIKLNEWKLNNQTLYHTSWCRWFLGGLAGWNRGGSCRLH